MMPFFVAGLVVLYGVNAGANAMMDSEEFRNDPRKDTIHRIA
jgi:F-type H+-transporting ATPase subunit j